MIHELCPTDLLAKERRGSLSVGEHSRLRAHLAACESCRLWQKLGRDFDHAAQVEHNDHAIAERIVARAPWSAEAQPSHTVRWMCNRSRRFLRWFLLPALGSIAAAAAATSWPMVARRLQPPSVGHAIVPAPTTITAAPTPAEAPEQVDAVSPLARLEPPPPAIPSGNTAETGASPRSARAVVASATVGETALTLYREANQARRRGETSRAIALFRVLQQSFPRSEESRLSHVALASALLDSGLARDALREYERYLGTPGSRSLAAEAMYGRARSLGAVGSRDAERAAWQGLQAEYPGSPYDTQATRRLRALE